MLQMTKYNCCIAQLRNVPGANSIQQCVEEACVEVLGRAHSSRFCESSKNWTPIAETLVKAYRYMYGCKKDRDSLFTGRHREQASSNRFKSHEERFNLDFDSPKKRKFFYS